MDISNKNNTNSGTEMYLPRQIFKLNTSQDYTPYNTGLPYFVTQADPNFILSSELPARWTDHTTFNWRVNDNMGSVIHGSAFGWAAINNLMNKDPMRDYHLEASAGLEILVERRQNITYQGALAWVWEPPFISVVPDYYQDLVKRSDDAMTRLFHLDPYIITPQNDQDFKIQIPLMWPFDRFWQNLGTHGTVDLLNYGFGNLRCYVIAPLEIPAISQHTAVPFKLSIRLTNYSLSTNT